MTHQMIYIKTTTLPRCTLACVARHAYGKNYRVQEASQRPLHSARTCVSGHGELLGERAQLTGREPERVYTRLQDKLLGHVGVGIHRREAVGLASRPRARAQPEGVRGARVVNDRLRAERGFAWAEVVGARLALEGDIVPEIRSHACGRGCTLDAPELRPPSSGCAPSACSARC